MEETEKLDSLYEESRIIVVNAQQGSVSLLQRRLKIGFMRADRIMAQLEKNGVVGPLLPDKPREVFIKEGSAENKNTQVDQDFDSKKDESKKDFDKACELYRTYVSTAETEEERIIRINLFRCG